MIHIYYGFGRGKTSTVNGSAIRAKGAGLKPLIFRFLKGRETHEDKIFIKNDIPIISNHPFTKFVIQMNSKEKKITKKSILFDFNLIVEKSKKYNYIILDEILDIVYLKFITQKQLINVVTKASKNAEILMTGHYKFKKIFAIADLITYYEPERHYFNKKIPPRKGIEY